MLEKNNALSLSAIFEILMRPKESNYWSQNMKHSGIVNFLPLVHLLLWAQLLTVTALCPAPFQIEANRCVYVDKRKKYSWCEANQKCKAIGGELLNEYASLKKLSRMPSVSCSGCRLWHGLSDLADERDTRKGRWQRINDKGVLPYDGSLWYSGMPSSNGNQDCLSSSDFTVKFIDQDCSLPRGFVCEYIVPETPPAAGFRQLLWKKTEFKKTSYNGGGNYCFKDVPVDSLIECTAAATTDGSTRRVLYNTKTKKCRLLQFTDAQVEKWIETGGKWIKFSI